MQIIEEDILVKQEETKEGPKLVFPFMLIFLQHMSLVMSLA